MNLPAAAVSYPPREIPLSTRLVILFGGPFSALGWVFTGLGLTFAFLFVGQADFTSGFYFRGPLETASGSVIASTQTHASEGGGKHTPGTPVFRHEYKFNLGGAEYRGTSYCTGGGLRDQQRVTVEFPAGQPGISRVEGMRRALFGPAAGFTLIFPAIGFVFVAISLWTGRKNLSLLINGEAAQTRNTGKEQTNTRVNNRRVYQVWFEFTDRHGALQKTSTRTSKPENLEGHAFEQLFYDANNPARCTLLRGLPGKVALDERGQVKPSSCRRVMGSVWGPLFAATLLLVSVIVWSKMR